MYVGCFKDSSDRVLESEKLFPLPNERLKCWRECICIFFTLCFYRQFLLDLNAFRKSYKKKPHHSRFADNECNDPAMVTFEKRVVQFKE